MRKNIVAGNWKMNKNLQEGIALAKELNEVLTADKPNCDVIICTPFIHLASVTPLVDSSIIGVGAENCADKASGAYTGEVSAEMVASTGAQYVILGHSERRAYYHETVEILAEKVKLAFWEFIQKQGSKDENNIKYFIDKENQEIVFKEINRAIDGLPFQCRQIFLLSRFSGKKSQEIAVELGISVRTVEAQLYRAMKRLREELAHLRGSAIFWLFLLRGERV